MEQKPDFSFHKSERLCSKRIIDALFAGGSKSMSAFPLRVVFMPVPVEAPAPLVSILVSVSKRRFKRAVKRNRVKRQIREAYRKQKHILTSVLPTPSGQGLVVAFLPPVRFGRSGRLRETPVGAYLRTTSGIPGRTHR